LAAEMLSTGLVPAVARVCLVVPPVNPVRLTGGFFSVTAGNNPRWHAPVCF